MRIFLSAVGGGLIGLATTMLAEAAHVPDPKAFVITLLMCGGCGVLAVSDYFK